MSKTELIAKDDISKDLNTRLRTIGEAFKSEDIAEMYEETERTRTSYQAKYLLTGIVLLGKKAELGHGKFVKWWEKTAKLQRAAVLPADSLRTVRVYMQLAKRFLAAVESGKLSEEFHQKKLDTLDTQAIGALITRDGGRQMLLKALETFVGDRSIRRMIQDFAAAHVDAVVEEEAERKAALAKGDPNAQAATGEDAKGQFDFFGTLEHDLKPTLDGWKAALSSPAWTRPDVPDTEKRKALAAMRDHLKQLDTQLADREKALKESAS